MDSFQTVPSDAPNGTGRAHITAAVSCYDSNCCTPDYGCVDSNYAGPCECDTYGYTGAQYQTCEYSCLFDACS